MQPRNSTRFKACCLNLNLPQCSPSVSIEHHLCNPTTRLEIVEALSVDGFGDEWFLKRHNYLELMSIIGYAIPHGNTWTR